jgi:hypothetical protein
MIDTDDRKDQICTKCGVGHYQETSIHDDWDGVLHCTNKKCNHEVKRYISDDNPPPKPEKVKLSPAAQAVLDAIESRIDRCAALSAALRAAADEVAPTGYEKVWKDSHWVEYEKENPVREKLLAIADELEAQ